MGVFRKGENWVIDYYVNGRRKRETIGPNKTLAENVLRKRKVEIAENRYLDKKKVEKVKFKDFARLYFENHCKVNGKGSCIAETIYLNPTNPKSLVAYFGEKYLYEIKPFMIEQYKRDRKQEVSAGTVNRTLNILSSMFNKAIDWDKTKENPMRKVQHFPTDNRRLRYLEKTEIKDLLNASSPRLKPIVTLAINTGMRFGEIKNLKWIDVDLQKDLICILEQKNNAKSYVPINDPARQALMGVRRTESPYVFCKDNGGPYSCRKSFSAALKKAGISGASFHTLRHTFASHLAMSGVNLNTVRELMRHKSLAMTQRYAHLSRDHKSRAVDTLAGQMDTIWTPTANSSKSEDFGSIVSQLNLT